MVYAVLSVKVSNVHRAKVVCGNAAGADKRTAAKRTIRSRLRGIVLFIQFEGCFFIRMLLFAF